MEKQENNKTGYPHIDRPWMKWYEETNYQPTDTYNTSILDYLRKKNTDRLDYTAISYYGKTISYQELLYDRANRASSVLTSLGVKKGSNIMHLMPNIPETGELWLGASQIGAISDFIDPRPDTMDLRTSALKVLEMIKYEKADYLVALDSCYLAMLKPIENELKELGYKNIVVVSASDSMNILGIIDYLKDVIAYNSLRNKKIVNETRERLTFYQALLKKIESMKASKQAVSEAIETSPIEILRYKDLCEQYGNHPFTEIKDGILVSYIGHTSGTSGSQPKPITLTNSNQIFAQEQAFKAGVNVDERERIIHELPFFSPLGAENNYLIDLASGATLFDIPEFEINEFGYLVKKVRPNTFMGTPSWLENLPQCDYLKKKHIKGIKRVIYGGGSMSVKNEKHLNDWLKENGSSGEIQSGHGMSELAGGATYNKTPWYTPGSMGIPFPDIIYAIVDPDIEDEMVPVNTKDEEGFIHGELAIASESLTPGMMGDDVIVKHHIMDGREYIRTKDIVKMNENGIFFFEERKDRGFTRYDGYKVRPADIEKVISKHPYVKDCMITSYYDEFNKGYMPIAHVILEDDVEATSVYDFIRITEDIINNQIITNKKMTSRQIPTRFKFRTSFPLTKNGKVSFKELETEELDGTEIIVDIEETNLAVGSIKVHSNEQPKVLKLK